MRILFVTGGSPWPANIGVNQRTYLIYKALSECGRVDLVINSSFVTIDQNQKDTLIERYGLIAIFNPVKKNDIQCKSISNFISAAFRKKAEDWFGTYLINKDSENWIKNRIEKEKYNIIITRYLKSAINTGVYKFSPIVLDVDDLKLDLVSMSRTGNIEGCSRKLHGDSTARLSTP